MIGRIEWLCSGLHLKTYMSIYDLYRIRVFFGVWTRSMRNFPGKAGLQKRQS